MTDHPIIPEWPEQLVPAEIPTMEYVVEAVGAPAVAEALKMPTETPVEELTHRIMTIEGGTYAGLVSEHGHTHFFLQRLGREALTKAMKLSSDTSDEGIRASIRELHRRSEAAKLGLPADATLADIGAAKDAQELRDITTELNLPDNATWADALRVRECDRYNLPRDCTEEELAAAMRRDIESAKPQRSNEIIMPVRNPFEPDEMWHNRTMYEN